MDWAAAIDKQTDVRPTDTNDHDTFVEDLIVTVCASVFKYTVEFCRKLSELEFFTNENLSRVVKFQPISRSICTLSEQDTNFRKTRRS